MSPVPSPPQPSSPSFGRVGAGGGGGVGGSGGGGVAESGLALASESLLLQQRLQRLQLIHSHPHPLHPPSPPLAPLPLPLPPHPPAAQRSDSPPGPVSLLLASRPATLQRASPPPAFQNLCAIREDSGDAPDPPETDTEMVVDEDRTRGEPEGVGAGVPSPSRSPSSLQRTASSGSLPCSLDSRQRGFAGNPQISITDTQGHVTDVDTGGQEAAARDAASPGSPARQSDSPLGRPGVVAAGGGVHTPLARPGGVGVGVGVLPSALAGAALAGGISSYPFSFLQGFGLINTNLASIPPTNGDSPSPADLAALYCSWSKPSSASSSSSSSASSHSRAGGHSHHHHHHHQHHQHHTHTSPTHSHSHSHPHQTFPHHPAHSHSSSRPRRHNPGVQDWRDMSVYNAWLASAVPLSDFSRSAPGSRLGSGVGGAAWGGRAELPAGLHHASFASASASSPSSPTYRTSPLSGSGSAPFSGFFSQPCSPLHQPRGEEGRGSLSSPPSPPSPLNGCFPAPSPSPSHSPSHPLPHNNASSHSDSNLLLFHSPLGLFHPSSVSPSSPSSSPCHSPSPHPPPPSPPSPSHQHHHPSPLRGSGGPLGTDGSMPCLLAGSPGGVAGGPVGGVAGGPVGGVAGGPVGGGADGEGSMSSLLAGSRTVEDVLSAITAALDSVCPSVAYERLERRFRLQQADLQMEVEVCDGEGRIPSRLHVRKLSGDHTHYAALCNHLLACVNN